MAKRIMPADAVDDPRGGSGQAIGGRGSLNPARRVGALHA
jgi:hypothetical protein